VIFTVGVVSVAKDRFYYSLLIEKSNALEIPLRDLLDLDRINPKKNETIEASILRLAIDY